MVRQETSEIAPPPEYTLDEKLDILYRMAWLNGLDGEKHLTRWRERAKVVLELNNESK